MTSVESPHRMVDPQDAVRLFVRNALVFEGRSSRAAFWWPVLGLVAAGFMVSMVDRVVLFGLPLLGFVFVVVTFVPGLALMVRRLHDIGKSGWWAIVAVVPVAGAAVLIWFAAQPGYPDANEFGADVEAGRGADEVLA
jgi:uncharacterized membrane protein YhaH (DUF805 family)